MNIGAALGLIFWVILEIAVAAGIFYSYEGAIRTKLVWHKIGFVLDSICYGTDLYFILRRLSDTSGVHLYWSTAVLVLAGIVTTSLILGAILGRFLWVREVKNRSGVSFRKRQLRNRKKL